MSTSSLEKPIAGPLVRVLSACRQWRMLIGLVALALFVLGEVLLHLPPRSLPRVRLDKVFHAVGYGGITAMALLLASLYLGWHGLWRKPQGAVAALTILCGLILLGYVDELTQPLTGRHFEWADLAADAFGILCCGAMFALFGRWITRRSSSATSFN